VSSAVAFLLGNLVAAALISGFLAYARKWRWVPVPFVVQCAIWATGYLLAAH
jgi:hypothetical protein